MWEAALEAGPVSEVLARAGRLEQRIMRLFGPPESEIAQTLRRAEASGVPLERLEITTCLRRGEIEIATVFDPEAAEDYAAFETVVAEEYGERLFARNGETIDDIVIAALAGRTIATAESCTGGLMAARLTDRGGSSAYALGGITAYSNEAKVKLAGVDPALIERHGAVSPEVASALADGAVAAFGADVGHRHHRHRRPGRGNRGEAGRDRVPVPGPRRRADRADGAAARRPRDGARADDDRRDASAASLVVIRSPAPPILAASRHRGRSPEPVGREPGGPPHEIAADRL